MNTLCNVVGSIAAWSSIGSSYCYTSRAIPSVSVGKSKHTRPQKNKRKMINKSKFKNR